MWRQKTARAIRLGFLTFVLLVCTGVGVHKHLLNGVETGDVALALACVVSAVTPVFLTMGWLLRGDETRGSLS